MSLILIFLQRICYTAWNRKLILASIYFRQKDMSTYSTSQLDMYDVPEHEIPWGLQEKLFSGKQLSDSERTRIMDAIYNHVTKFT